MNLSELLIRLRAAGISDAVYSLDPENPPYDGLLLRKANDKWLVLYSDRGTMRELARLDSEEAACEYFYQRLMNDGAARPRLHRPN